ncbi:MAG: adenosylcobinamide-phosphate synthase CbiB [Leptolyngbyaceae cyanobacterium]
MTLVAGKPLVETVQALSSNLAICILLAAAVTDFIVGDPWGWPHPVRLIGWCISLYAKLALRWISSAQGQFIAGIFLGIGLPFGMAWLSGFMLSIFYGLSSVLGTGVAITLMASCWATKSLRKAAEDVMHGLKARNLSQARSQLQYYVGRDTENLTETEVLRALLECISENATDGVFAPFFYAVLGLLLSAQWGAALAISYKALSTLDSMVGYQTVPYTYLGRFSARFEDVMTWLPCRLTVVTIALLSGSFYKVIAICKRDAAADPSPNSGWSECVYAAALDVQLGGLNYYQGKPRYKPLLGDDVQPISIEKIQQALALTRYGFLLWLVLGISLLAFRYHIHCG